MREKASNCQYNALVLICQTSIPRMCLSRFFTTISRAISLTCGSAQPGKSDCACAMPAEAKTPTDIIVAVRGRDIGICFLRRALPRPGWCRALPISQWVEKSPAYSPMDQGATPVPEQGYCIQRATRPSGMPMKYRRCYAIRFLLCLSITELINDIKGLVRLNCPITWPILSVTKHRGGQYMNKLSLAQRVRILNLLIEGNSMRDISRSLGVSFNTVNKLLQDAGRVCLEYHNKKVRGLKCERVQCDEIWAYLYSKDKI